MEEDEEVIQVSPDEKKATQLYQKLEELLTKLTEDNLSPFKRLMIQNKIDIIQIRLERRLSKLELKEYEETYEGLKDEAYHEFNEHLAKQQEELDAIFDKIEQSDRELENLLASGKKRESAYKEINNIGNTTKRKSKSTRELYTFDTSNIAIEGLEEQKRQLEELHQEKQDKIDSIKESKEEFLQDQKESDKQHKANIREYKPSLWNSFKQGIMNIFNNISQFARNSKEEREAVKKAKQAMKEEIRAQQAQEQNNENAEMVNYFREEIKWQMSEMETQESEPSEEDKYIAEAEDKIIAEEAKAFRERRNNEEETR